MSRVNRLFVEMSRGTLVVDENLQSIVDELRSCNITVVTPAPGTSDDEIKRRLLSNRIFVTNNSSDFVYDASSFVYGIIATEGVAKEPKGLAKMISSAIIKFGLWSYPKSFILRLDKEGNHVITDLSD